jgi:hypothetical protein
MPEFILPESDPWADDEQDQDRQEAVDEHEQKPAGDWRSAPDIDSFMAQYADSGGAVHDYESAQGQQRAVAEREARIQQAQQQQQEAMQGEGLSELRGAKTIAEFMMAYQKHGGVASDGWTIAEDSDGRMQVYEVD